MSLISNGVASDARHCLAIVHCAAAKALGMHRWLRIWVIILCTFLLGAHKSIALQWNVVKQGLQRIKSAMCGKIISSQC